MSDARADHRSLFLGLLLGLASGALPACRSTDDAPPTSRPGRAREPDPPGRAEDRLEVDPETGRRHAWSVFVTPGRGAMKHGLERITFPDGTPYLEREFRYGKPSGVWRSYYENGQRRTECFYLGPDVERTMTFWREDGKLSAQGPACDGARRGKWRFWWTNGQLAEEGEYRAGLKEGAWTGWSRDGKRRFEREYARNVRVSQREVAVEEPGDPASQ